MYSSNMAGDDEVVVAWQACAERLGLAFVGGSGTGAANQFRLTGTYAGRRTWVGRDENSSSVLDSPMLEMKLEPPLDLFPGSQYLNALVFEGGRFDASAKVLKRLVGEYVHGVVTSNVALGVANVVLGVTTGNLGLPAGTDVDAVEAAALLKFETELERAHEAGNAAARANSLLTKKSVNALKKLAKHGTITLRDRSIHLTATSALTETDILVERIEDLSRVVDSIDESRARVPVRRELAQVEDHFARAAEALGLKLIDCPLGIMGTLDGARASSFMEVSGKPDALEWQVVAEAMFPREPGIELTMKHHRPGLLERLRIVRQHDPEIGERDLDDALEISTNDINELRRRLDQNARDDLRSLLSQGEFSVLADRVRVAHVSFGAIEGVLPAAARVAYAISGAQAGGPYR
jgi:hypothetical protein